MTRQPRALFDPRFIRRESRRAYRLAFILFWSIGLTLLLQRYVVSAGWVEGSSMHPTFEHGDILLINKMVYRIHPPQRGEVVILRNWRDRSEENVKRIIGLPGEILQLVRGELFINGRRLQEPYVSGPTRPDLGPVRLEASQYFVMGDHRAVSEDSRDFGPITLRDIEGRVLPAPAVMSGK